MYPSIEYNKVWFNKDVHLCVTIEHLYRFCTWHTMLNVFRLVYTRIFIDNYLTTLFVLSQNANVWVVWLLSRGVGLWVQSKTGPRWDWFIIYHKVWHVLIEPKVYTTTCWSFLFLHSYEYITYVINVLYSPPYFGLVMHKCCIGTLEVSRLMCSTRLKLHSL